ncbi:MAG TPA: thioredoxin family protein [Isosphaeraceae bacterium]
MRKTLLSLAIVALMAAPTFAGVKIGDKAPSFDGLPAVVDGQDASLTLSDIKEDVVVVVFLANHCPAVVANEDRIIDMANSFKDKSVKVVGISCTGAPSMKAQDDIPAIKTRVKEKGYTYAYAYDEPGVVGKAYGATRTPEFFVLDKERKVRYHGALDNSVMNETKVTKNYIKGAVDALLAGKEVETPETQAQGCGIAYAKSK